jgi:hypothetical protein
MMIFSAWVHRRRHVAGTAILLGQDLSMCEKFIGATLSFDEVMFNLVVW